MTQRTERLQTMIELLTRGPYPTREDLERRFEISERTVFQDFQFMRKNLGMEIELDPVHHVYFNKNPKKRLPPFDLSEQEIRALKLSKMYLSHNTGDSFEQVLYSALTKIADRLPDGTDVKSESIKELPLNFKSPPSSISIKYFWDLNEACVNRQTVQIDYYAPSSDRLSSRKLDPYRMLVWNGNWYVTGLCHRDKSLKTFALQRIRKLSVLNETFEHRQDLNLDDRLDSAFQIELGADKFEARIRFSALAARYIREKRWHPSQRIEENQNGSIDLTFVASSKDEVKRWVLYYGAEAEVIEPRELRDMVSAELNSALRNYSV